MRCVLFVWLMGIALYRILPGSVLLTLQLCAWVTVSQ